MTAVIISCLYIIIVLDILLLPTSEYASIQSAQSTDKVGVSIDNQDVLQACVTVLIGVLIFLTLERQFQKKRLDIRYFTVKTSVLSNKTTENKFAPELVVMITQAAMTQQMITQAAMTQDSVIVMTMVPAAKTIALMMEIVLTT